MTLDEFLTKLKARGLTWFISPNRCIRTKIKVGESERWDCPIDIVKGWDGEPVEDRYRLDEAVGFTALEIMDAADAAGWLNPAYASLRHQLLEACGLGEEARTE